jgi:hypothetical protein
VAGFRIRGARTAIERLYPHSPHERLHMPAADLAPLWVRTLAYAISYKKLVTVMTDES